MKHFHYLKHLYRFFSDQKRVVYFLGEAPQVYADDHDDTPREIKAEDKEKLPTTLDGRPLPDAFENQKQSPDIGQRAREATRTSLVMELADPSDQKKAQAEHQDEALQSKIVTLLDQMFGKNENGQDVVSDQETHEAKGYLVAILKAQNPDMDVQNFHIYESKDRPGSARNSEGEVECSFRSEGVEKTVWINVKSKQIRYSLLPESAVETGGQGAAR